MLTGARPDLVDNESIDHAAALAYLLADLEDRHPLAAATGYVNLGGLRILAMNASEERSTRVLLGAAPRPGLDGALPLQRFEDQLASLRGERDFSRFPPSRAGEALAAVDAWLARDDVLVRRFTGQFLHGKAYLVGTAADGRAALVSSANLTAAGMYANRELGLVDYQPQVVARAVAWFDRLWDSSDPYKDQLRELLFPALPAVTPMDVYLRALLELYGSELESLTAGGTPESHIVLADFQQYGYERARAILEARGGVLYADGVGTGKTEIGLALIEEYVLRQGRHALVIAPAQLRGMWQRRLDEARLPAQVVSFEELASDEQLADPGRAASRRLSVAKDSYRLVVVDEAHAFRNAGNTWYRAMTRLLGGAPKHVALLTATPINNTLWDLFNLVMLFARHDRALAAAGIDSIRAEFLAAGANERDAERLNPDRLFRLADAVSVRRDRAFIVEHFPGARFPDGTPLRFPEPQLQTRRYDLDASSPGLVSAVADAIGALTMARYRPSAYELGIPEAARERALAALLQSAVLKRFESCWAACLATVHRMITVHEAFLAAWGDLGTVPPLDALRGAGDLESGGEDLGRWLEEVGLDAAARPVAEFEPVYREHVASDLALLQAIESDLDALRYLPDPKLQLLAAILRENPGKTCVFASYSETVRYLDAGLDAALGSRRDRVVIIGGDTTPDQRTRMLARLCPDTVVEPGYRPPDGEVDLLISTDVVSEGQNLQQAQAVISYDMPWNPQRVVQRNGRVLRLRSPHETVWLTTMLPVPGELEPLLRLEARIQAKIVASGVYGMEVGVLGDDAQTEARIYEGMDGFTDRLESGDATLLSEAEDAGGSFAGEQLRAALIRAAAEGEVRRLRALPWGIGATFRQGPGVPSTGPAGVFFACRTSDASGGARYWRFVDDQGVSSDELPIIRRINPGPADGADMPADIEPAWRLAVESIIEEHNGRANPPPEINRLPPSQRFALELLADPAVALPVGAEDAYELLSAPRDGAVKLALSDVQRRLAARDIGRIDAAREIVGIVREYGLTPVPPPPELQSITQDDVGVVCWMRVLSPERIIVADRASYQR